MPISTYKAIGVSSPRRGEERREKKKNKGEIQVLVSIIYPSTYASHDQLVYELAGAILALNRINDGFFNSG